ncbi:14501_t:CDS:2, partial [Racocetra fulgida]
MPDLESLYTLHAYGKLSKVRFAASQQAYDSRITLFATGTWDEKKNNVLTLWKLEEIPISLRNLVPFSYENKIIAKIDHNGDVRDMQFINDSSDTQPKCLQVHQGKLLRHTDFSACDPLSLSFLNSFKVRTFSENKSAAATGMAIRPFNTAPDSEIASVGEDGRLVLFKLTDQSHYRIV